ncbi:hypothetical protein T11_5582 [Trichinella zimbabwensis]|uniref:Uncharacterized protein n=1 Tax=Trichinella zimbabwensis TaxID=268475 RepID=A0A0V1GZ37_9BILA|nr:hypothetical protein T11_5582 [Trichinella zimbabwensis]
MIVRKKNFLLFVNGHDVGSKQKYLLRWQSLSTAATNRLTMFNVGFNSIKKENNNNTCGSRKCIDGIVVAKLEVSTTLWMMKLTKLLNMQLLQQTCLDTNLTLGIADISYQSGAEKVEGSII